MRGKRRIATIRIIVGHTLEEWEKGYGDDEDKGWDYPLEELDYLCEKAWETGYQYATFWLIGGRLYEAPPTNYAHSRQE